MKIYFSGFGCLVGVLAPIAFLVAMLALPAHERGEWWVLGALGVGLGVVLVPVGIALHRAGRSQDHFMYIPVGAWGALFLLAGLGFFAAEGVSRWQRDAGDVAASGACVELAEVMGSCTSLPPSARTMFRAGCEASPPEVGVACLTCVRGASDPCDPSGCRAACRFGPRP